MESAHRIRPQAGPITSVLLAGMAGGMAWGIRGQYGHETGAMIAGVLVGFVLVLLHGRHLSALSAARAVAMFALGISVGGSMTYGQTVGLTHDTPLVGNVEAYRWGMLGLAIKGGVWIGLGGCFFGMVLGGKRYTSLELCALSIALMGAMFAGVYLLNRPYDPEARLLPQFYFSDHWYWEEDVTKPRRERWGGLAFALGSLLLYVGVWKRDWTATAIGVWSTLGGAIGFPAGQAVQAHNAWYGEQLREAAQRIVFRAEPELLTAHDFMKHFNWWNMMETTFGFVFGAVVGFGVWLHRRSIVNPTAEAQAASIRLSPFFEWLLVAIHLRLLVAWNFQSFDQLDRIADHALPMVIIPILGVMAGRLWPFLVSLPIVMLPIAGKTIRQLSFGEEYTSVERGWDWYVVLPLAVASLVACYFATRPTRPEDQPSGWFSCIGLLTATWLYFGLNFAFFHVPWPWLEWTGRTPNGLFFLIASILLTLAAFIYRPQDKYVGV